ncbi:A24 family peptidase [Hyphomicrobium sp. 99]|uniref:prepilin peptidase n=1 Tax=Hyphomicrobium sp. 99 TaxID=1163419 RepID=UPI0018CE63E0|nr:A24 family peptidase [Hyphomicrobium sp. 99]
MYLLTGAPALSEEVSAGAIAISLCLAATLALLSAIDIQIQRLPDILTLPLAVVGILVTSVGSWEQALWHVAAAVLGFLMLYGISQFYRYFRNKDGLGLGDAKLLAASGAWLGIVGLPSTLLISSVSAVTGALLAKLIGIDVTRETRIPFGPFISFGLWFVWLYGPLV